MTSRKESRLWTFGRAMAGIIALAVVVTGCGKSDKDDGAESSSDSQLSKAACEVTELSETEDGDEAETANAVSPSGEYILGTTDHDGSAAMWRDGDDPVAISDSYSDFEATDVNSSGVVIGTRTKGSSEEDSPENAWKWQDGEFTELQVPDGDANSAPTDINDNGDIVGHSGGLSDTGEENSEDTDAPEHAVFWEEEATEGIEIDAEDDAVVGDGLTGITDDGTIVGTSSGSGEEPPQPWTWKPEGSATEPPSVPAEEDDETGISQVTGNLVEWHEGGENGNYYRWDQSDVGDPEEFQASPRLDNPAAMDSQGRVYGNTSVNEDGFAPAVQDGNEVSVLPNFEDPPAGGEANEIYATSDDGEALVGQSSDGTMKPAMWTCDW